MASILIGNLDERTWDLLRLRAARHKCSMQDEARNILRSALTEDMPLAQAIADRFKALGGVEIDVQPREPVRKPPSIRRARGN